MSIPHQLSRGYKPHNTFHPPKGTGSLTKILFEAQNGICPACGMPLVPLQDLCLDQDRLSVDHVHPRSAGGADHLGNMLAMHRRCNSAKGNRAPTGCELIWHALVLEKLEFWTQPPDTSGPTLGDIWPR